MGVCVGGGKNTAYRCCKHLGGTTFVYRASSAARRSFRDPPPPLAAAAFVCVFQRHKSSGVHGSWCLPPEERGPGCYSGIISVFGRESGRWGRQAVSGEHIRWVQRGGRRRRDGEELMGFSFHNALRCVSLRWRPRGQRHQRCCCRSLNTSAG